MTRAFALCLGLADLAVWAMLPSGAVVGHLALIAAAAVLVRLLRLGQGAPLATVLTACLGPAGAPISLLMHSDDPDQAEQLAPWYSTLAGRDPAPPRAGLARRLAQGRLAGAGTSLPRPTPAILSDGTRAEKYALLRQIAWRRAHLSETLLRQALDNSDPAVRVQAAALAARPADRRTGPTTMTVTLDNSLDRPAPAHFHYDVNK